MRGFIGFHDPHAGVLPEPFLFCNIFLLFLLQNRFFTMQSIESKILEAIRAEKYGKLIFPEDFSELRLPEAIRLALYCLEKENLEHQSCNSFIRNLQR